MACIHMIARTPALRRTLALPVRSLSSLPPNLQLADDSLLTALPPQDRAVLEPVFEREPITTEFIEAVVHPFSDSATEPSSIQLSSKVFGRPLRLDILHNVVVWQRACMRQGTSKTKGKGEVRGSTKKPWDQKGSGRARAGHKRAPHWKGGGHAHAKTPRDWSYKINKKVRQLGLCTALSQKLAEGTLSIVDSLEIESLRTKHLYERLEERNWQRDSLFIDFPACNNENFQIASSNIELVEFMPSPRANVLDILDYKNLILTTSAVEAITWGLTKKIRRHHWDPKHEYPDFSKPAEEREAKTDLVL